MVRAVKDGLASARKLPEGDHEVTIEVAAKKLRADDLGAEKDAALDYLIEVGVLDASGTPLLLEKRPPPQRHHETHPHGARHAREGRDRSAEQARRSQAG